MGIELLCIGLWIQNLLRLKIWMDALEIIFHNCFVQEPSILWFCFVSLLHSWAMLKAVSYMSNCWLRRIYRDWEVFISVKRVHILAVTSNLPSFRLSSFILSIWRVAKFSCCQHDGRYRLRGDYNAHNCQDMKKNTCKFLSSKSTECIGYDDTQILDGMVAFLLLETPLVDFRFQNLEKTWILSRPSLLIYAF